MVNTMISENFATFSTLQAVILTSGQMSPMIKMKINQLSFNGQSPQAAQKEQRVIQVLYA